MKHRWFTPEHVKKQFGVELSKRYTKFLAKQEWKTHDKKWSLVPSYEGAVQLRFAGDALESFFHDDWPDDPDYGHPAASEVELGGERGWVPLATLGTEEAQFLVVQANDEACAVAMWEHETGELVPCIDTLDDFLANLGKTAKGAKASKPALDLQDASDLSDEIGDVVKEPASAQRDAKLAKMLAKLERMLAVMPKESTLSRDRAVVLGLALLAKGSALRALRRFEEAVTVFEQTTPDGGRVSSQDAIDVLLFELDQPERAIAICAQQEDPRPLVRRTWALALFRLGRLDEATSHLEAIVTRQVSAAIALDQTVDRAKETARRRKLLAAEIEKRARAWKLDARALISKLDKS